MNRNIIRVLIGMSGLFILGIFIASYIDYPYSIIGLLIIGGSTLVIFYNLTMASQFETDETKSHEGHGVEK